MTSLRLMIPTNTPLRTTGRPLILSFSIFFIPAYTLSLFFHFDYLIFHHFVNFHLQLPLINRKICIQDEYDYWILFPEPYCTAFKVKQR
jgi:hypothetical protein